VLDQRGRLLRAIEIPWHCLSSDDASCGGSYKEMRMRRALLLAAVFALFPLSGIAGEKQIGHGHT